MIKVKSGIYLIKNKIDGKVYVGSSIDIDNRWKCHKNNLIKNKHHSTYLQNAWNKYGESNFELELLELVDDPNKLIEREQYWMDKFQCYDDDKGYNINPTAGSHLGRLLSEESKVKIAKGSRIRRPVSQIDMNGNIINEYFSTNNASKTTGVSVASIKYSMKEKVFFREFAWVLKDVYLNNQEIIKQYFTKNENGYSIPKWRKGRTRGVVRITPQGQEDRFASAIKAEESIGVSNYVIKRLCDIEEKDTNGNTWMYEEDYFLMKIDNERGIFVN